MGFDLPARISGPDRPSRSASGDGLPKFPGERARKRPATTERTEISFGGLANPNAYTEAQAWVAATFPTAAHTGMGYWKVPRTVHIIYGVGRVVVTAMPGHTLSEFGL